MEKTALKLVSLRLDNEDHKRMKIKAVEKGISLQELFGLMIKSFIKQDDKDGFWE